MAKKDPTKNKVGVTKEGELRAAYETGTPLRNIFNVPADQSDYAKLLSSGPTRNAMNRIRWANYRGSLQDYPEGQDIPSFEFNEGQLAEMKKRGLTREYIDSWQPSNYPEEFGLGGWIKENKEGIWGGLKALAGGALMATGIGGPLGAGLLASGVKGIAGEIADGNSGDQLAQQQAMMAGMQPQIAPEAVDPTVNPEGMTQVRNQYAPTFCRGGKVKKKMPMGGTVDTQLVELEEGEPFRTPDGIIGVVKNDDQLSHANGGATMPLEVGTQILGKGKDSDTKKTYKEMGKKLAMQKKKYDKILDSKAGTYSVNAAKAMNSKLDNKWNALFQKQERTKASQIPQQQGIPRADLGGLLGTLTTQIQSAGAANQTPGFLGKLWGGAKDFVGQQGGLGGPNGMFNTAMQLAPVGYNLMQGMQPAEQFNAQDFYNPEYGQAIQGQQRAVDLLSNRRANIDPMLEANRNAQAIAAYNARTQGGLSAGAVASNRMAGTAQRMRGDQSAMAWGQNLNNQYLAQQAAGEGQLSQMRAGLGQQRAGTEFNVANINQQAEAARRAQLGAGFTGISDYAQRQQLMAGQQSADQQRLGILEGMNPFMRQWFPGMYGGAGGAK